MSDNKKIAMEIVSNIFSELNIGDVVNTGDYNQLEIWKKETKPIIDCLQKNGFISIRYGRNKIFYRVNKYITSDVVEKCC